MERQTVYQVSMFGGEEVAGDVVDRCRAMLAEEPETREDYERAWLRYLARYHGLPEATVESVLMCLERAPGFRTVANRCQELMRADASLQPGETVMRLRQAQRRQGPIR